MTESRPAYGCRPCATEVVTESGADLVVIGNVGLNTLTGRILGSVPQKVARRAGVDVLIAHTS
jgi:nucleotide-binding universal stress UspA family protein